MENGTEDARSARIDATLGSAERKSNGAERGVWAARTRHDEVAREPGYLRRPGRELAAPAIGGRRHGWVVTRRHRARASSASVAPVTRPLSRWASGELNKRRFLRAPVAWSGLVGRSARALFACASCGVQSTKTRRRRRAGRCTRGGCAAMPVPSLPHEILNALSAPPRCPASLRQKWSNPKMEVRELTRKVEFVFKAFSTIDSPTTV